MITSEGKPDCSSHFQFVIALCSKLSLYRSSAPNSLSIWTHHIRGLSFHQGFKPQGCKYSIDAHAITAAAGMQMLELNEQAHLRNLTFVSGGAGSGGSGGYLTGGGHAALSSTYGLAADQVLEMEIVTPGGEILTINECQDTDLFWAMRGVGCTFHAQSHLLTYC
jgi:FAD/FMN-containing dehydrogenase